MEWPHLATMNVPVYTTPKEPHSPFTTEPKLNEA